LAFDWNGCFNNRTHTRNCWRQRAQLCIQTDIENLYIYEIWSSHSSVAEYSSVLARVSASMGE
jgi:hypothetical protein